MTVSGKIGHGIIINFQVGLDVIVPTFSEPVLPSNIYSVAYHYKFEYHFHYHSSGYAGCLKVFLCACS